MATPQRFRTNPVELAIFSIVALIFFNSVYNLLYDHPGFHTTTLTTMAANPISEGRSPASTSLVNLDVKCDAKTVEQNTTASKVRLSGALCGTDEATPDPSLLLKTQVVNNATKITAAVFTDVNAGKFSTDYISLNVGKNPIHLEFTYRDGRVVKQDIDVTRTRMDQPTPPSPTSNGSEAPRPGT